MTAFLLQGTVQSGAFFFLSLVFFSSSKTLPEQTECIRKNVDGEDYLTLPRLLYNPVCRDVSEYLTID